MTKDELEKFFSGTNAFLCSHLAEKLMVMRCQRYMHRNSLQLLRLECWQGKMMLAFVKPYLMAMSSTARWERRRCEFEV